MLTIGRGTYIEIETHTGKRSHHPIEYMHLRCNIMHEKYKVPGTGDDLVIEHIGTQELVQLFTKQHRHHAKGADSVLIVGRDVFMSECTAGFEIIGVVSAQELLARKGSKGIAYLPAAYAVKVDKSRAVEVAAFRTNARLINSVAMSSDASEVKV